MVEVKRVDGRPRRSDAPAHRGDATLLLVLPLRVPFFSLRVRDTLQPRLTVGKGTINIDTAAWPALARRLVVAIIQGSHHFGRAAPHPSFVVRTERDQVVLAVLIEVHSAEENANAAFVSIASGHPPL